MDVSVSFLLENMKQLVMYHAELIGGAEDELKKLTEELHRFRIILEDTSKNYKKDKIFEDWEKRIREAVYDIEDTIDTCITRATAKNAGRNVNRLKKLFSTTKTISLAKQVRTLREKTVKPLMDEFHEANFTPADDSQPDTITIHATEIRQQKSQHIVGLEKETESFVDVLAGEPNKFEICSIIGMAGLGKTTLAWKIFEESTIKHEITIRIWVNISDTLNMKRVLLEILSKFETKPDDSLSEENLTEKVKGYLEKPKFLIVMDDIWTVPVWEKLEAILPINNTSGRVLITTRSKDVGCHSSVSLSHNLRFLETSESWELLQYQVFRNHEEVRRRKLVSTFGERIAEDCKGLPLSIVVIGGILATKTSRAGTNMTALENAWKDVSESVNGYLVNSEGNDVRMSLLGRILSLSYEKLPYDLRNCFLYLGVFPEDAKIHIKKLIRLWIAEGFVKEVKNKSLEEVAHENLKELINLNLVTVRIAKPNGEAKVCQIHDLVREICKEEGGKLNLFREVSKVREKIATLRRLCVHSHAPEFFSKVPKMGKARSFLCFNDSPMTLEPNEAASVTDNFGLLRVYDAQNIKFPAFPLKFMEQLNHLRYLTLTVDDVYFKILPEIVTDLWNLQTLIVETPSPTLEVEGDIWKMRQLRHFKTRASIIIKNPRTSEGDQNLQTLSRLAPQSCTDAFCRKATGVHTLGIQGDLRDLGESDRFRDLDSVKKLKLVHQVRGGVSDRNSWKHPPSSRGFPPKLRILVLSGTNLEWDHMSLFSAMNTLEELKLKENAFRGNDWVADGEGFLSLVCLHIDRADQLRHWKIKSNVHFPKLRSLYISNCEKLLEIPSTLAKSLELLSLETVHPDAVKNAQEIKEAQQKQKLEWTVMLEITAADKKR